MKISLVILTYNEIIGLREIFHKIPLDGIEEIFAVDGGSNDGTLEFFREKGVTTYLQQVRGRGDAFRIAFEKAIGDAVIFFSPDGNEDPADIVKFRNHFENGGEIVIGNRMSNGGHNEEDEQILKFRKWANNIFTLFANITWNRGPYVYDTINGYRGIMRSAWEKIKPDGDGYTIEYQSSIRAFKQKLQILEFPTNERKRLDNKTGSPSISTGYAFVKIYLRELWL